MMTCFTVKVPMVAVAFTVTLYAAGVEDEKLQVWFGDTCPAVSTKLVGHVAVRPVAFTVVRRLTVPANPALFPGRLDTVNVVEFVPPDVKVIG